MRIGFLGTGAITEAVVTGLSTAPEPPDIVISPRTIARSRALATQFGNVAVAADNQAVLDHADIVVLALRPQDIVAALEPLRFRGDHIVVSFVALLPLESLRHLAKPAAQLCRAIPLPFAALRVGPLALWPALPQAADLLGRLGTVISPPSEALLEMLWSTTALMAPFYEQLNQVSGWLVANGVPAALAGEYTTRLFAAWSEVAVKHTDELALLRDASQTRRGLNEQALRLLSDENHYRSLHAALEVIRRRLIAAHEGGLPNSDR
jgi:pyrroline-5-carboxylate reductase